MALEAPMRNSMGSTNAFSPFQADISITSPTSTTSSTKFNPVPASTTSSVDSAPPRPNSHLRAIQSQVMSPTGASDIVGPSPVTSIGTETTEIEDDEQAGSGHMSNGSSMQLNTLKTNIPAHVRHASSEEAVSVIHAPESFREWVGSHTPEPATRDNARTFGVISSPPSEDAEQTTFHNDAHSNAHSNAPPPISTDVKPVRYASDIATPQAQNLSDLLNESSRLRSSSVSGLEDIPETHEADLHDGMGYGDNYVTSPHMDGDGEIGALKAALEECWTLCNTLANLSSIHRERVFINSATPDAHETAWKCCWKLCQRLYQTRDVSLDNFSMQTQTNLELCRDFCQALFDVRTRKDELADSVLRVSFEMNNHLYSAQDFRNLPEPFIERTLDFYITLCHRLMKQRNELMVETDNLLRACWALAEMLFNLRQNSRDGRAPDAELLGSAVQACWELCDIFREGWTQVRPDRGTPRPSQLTFQQKMHSSETASVHSSTTRVSSMSKRDSFQGLQERPGSVASMSSLSRKSRQLQPPPVPETPVTEFEDTPISPESSSPQMPNIMVFGTNGDSNSVGGGSSRGVSASNHNSHNNHSNHSNHPRWPSGASNMSGFSQGSNKTSSTATTATSGEDINIVRIKVLLLRAAIKIGFNREQAASDGTGGAKTLHAFVKGLPTGSFGSQASHASLLKSYKNLVAADKPFRTANSLPARGRRVMASDVAQSIGWMILRSNQYSFLRELFKFVFGFPLEEAASRKNSFITV